MTGAEEGKGCCDTRGTEAAVPIRECGGCRGEFGDAILVMELSQLNAAWSGDRGRVYTTDNRATASAIADQISSTGAQTPAGDESVIGDLAVYDIAAEAS